MVKRQKYGIIRFPGNRAKALTLSYDDGVIYDRQLIEILDRYGLKATFNLNSARLSDDPDNRYGRTLTPDEAKALYQNSPHEVAVHTLSHKYINQLSVDEVTYEVMQDRLNLEEAFGGIVRGMAYPYGVFSDVTDQALKACGIVYSRTVQATLSTRLPTDFLHWNPTCHHSDARLTELTDKFLNASVRNDQPPILFYLWGHSYEFNDQNNWDVIENFAASTGNRDDIWYATNMEIYEYMTDFRRLVYSADGQTVQNPTARTLYFNLGDHLLSIAPGEMLRLPQDNDF